MTNNTITPIVHVKNNEVFANSRDVAEFFGKRHDNVMRDIDEITSNLRTSQNMEMFQLTNYRDSMNRKKPCVDMTKDGFTLLVMGYTGAKAMEFKLAYIKRFNEMEAELRNQTPQVPTNFAEALQLAADQAKQLEEMTPKAVAYDKYHDASGLMTITDVAKTMGLSAQKLNEKLVAAGNVYDIRKLKQGRKIPRKKMIDAGYFAAKNFLNDTSKFGGIVYKVTPKGAAWMQENFG